MLQSLIGQIIRRARGVSARVLVAIGLVFGVSACASEGGPELGGTQANGASPEQMYQSATRLERQGELSAAIKAFDEIERLHPTSQYAKRGILASANASYKNGDFDRAVASGRRYLDFYPSDEQADQAQYIVALALYDQITDIGREQSRTRQALQALRQLVSRYPDSRFRRDAELRIDLAVNNLAGKEMEVGRFYLKRRNYIAAINRFRTVIERYQQTSHTPEALHRLVEAYLGLGVKREAQTAAAVLGHNFPGSQWYADSYKLLTGVDLTPNEDRGSWISRAWTSVVGE